MYFLGYDEDNFPTKRLAFSFETLPLQIFVIYFIIMVSNKVFRATLLRYYPFCFW